VTSPPPDPAPVDPAPAPAAEAVPAEPGRRVRRADVLVAAGAVVFALLLVVPWFRRDAFDLGFGHRVAATSADGLDSGLLVTALVLLVLAACWSLLPAVADLPVPFPRALVTSCLVAPAFLLTLLEWLTTLDIGVSVAGLLALLTVAGVLVVAVRQLVPQARAWLAAEHAVEPGDDRART
jgi:hypothetical protein